MNLFDILGPVMVGPSSSHTAGAVRIGRMARALLGQEPVRAQLLLHGSFASTGEGHGTHQALVAGLLGLSPADGRVPDSFRLARERGLSFSFGTCVLRDVHPNSALIRLEDAGGGQLEVGASSPGGGRIRVFQVDGLHTSFSGELPTLVVHNTDQPGCVSQVTGVLAGRGLPPAQSGRPGRQRRHGHRVRPAHPRGRRPGRAGPARYPAGHPLHPGRTGGAPLIAFDSIAQMLQDTEQSGLPLWENILESDCRRQDLPRARSLERMGAMLDAMVQADESYQAQDRSHSGLSGGDGAKMTLYAAGDPLCGPLLSQVMAGALRMGECNACMKRIVAAPTAGACGVLPAVLLPCARHFSLSREQLVQALYVASGFGMVIAARASISGAEGGCQAEIGSAAAMAAPALVHLQGGTPEQMANACAMAVKNLLGLVCDPVGGLVEVPCVKRNVIGAMDALSAAQMALAGIESRVPPDQVLDAMAEVGRSLPPSLRETGKGGLAATPFGMAYAPKEG